MNAEHQSLSLLPAQAELDASVSGFNTTAQFDPHLNALGLIPGSAWPMSTYGQALPPRARNTYTQAQCHDNKLWFRQSDESMNDTENSAQTWFSGSRYLMNSMETGSDLTMFNVSNIDFSR
jgi:hypothetical protein